MGEPSSASENGQGFYGVPRVGRCSDRWAVSLADLLVAPHLALFTQTPEWSALGATHKSLAAWLARMAAR
jgi:hypothetical protein